MVMIGGGVRLHATNLARLKVRCQTDTGLPLP